MHEAQYFSNFEKPHARSNESELCIVVNAPHAVVIEQSAQDITLFIDQEPIRRDLTQGQYQILPASSDYQLIHPDWIRMALDLLDFSLIGRGPLQLGLTDLKEILSGTDSQQLYFAILSADQLFEVSPLHFRSLFARLVCPSGSSYRRYLELGLSITGKLPKNAPFRFGLAHDNIRLTNLMLLGELVTT